MSYRNRVLELKPRAYWSLNDAATVNGQILKDLTGNGYDVALWNGTLGVPGAVRGEATTAVSFAGGGYAITPGEITFGALVGAHTLEAWVKPATVGPLYGIVEKTIGGHHNQCASLFITNGVVYYRLMAPSLAGGYGDTTAPATPNAKGWIHIVGTYDGQTARLYLNSVLVKSTPVRGPLFDGGGQFILGSLGDNLYNLSGSLDEVAIYPRPLTPDEIATHYMNTSIRNRPYLITEVELSDFGGWTPVDDVILGSTSFNRGLPGIKSTDFVAATGMHEFSLDNSEYNSQRKLGLYTPGHANCLPGFNNHIGVRCSLVVQGESFVQFTGRILNIMTSPGANGIRRVKVIAVDYMDQLARKRLVDLPLQVEATDDEVFSMIIADMPVKPRAVQIDRGFDTLQYAFDTMKAERAVPTSEIGRLCRSTLRRCYIKKDGTLTFENRTMRAINTATNVISLTPEDFPLDLGPTIEDNRDILVNRVQTTLHPRKTGATTDVILFVLEGKPLVQANYPFAIRGFYTEPGNLARRAGGLDMLPAQPGIDYVFNAAEDGSGSDYTAAVLVSTIYTANSVVFQIQSPVNCYCIKLQARGTAVTDQANVITEASNEASIQRSGENNLALDMPYTGDVAFGQEVVQYLLFLEQQTSKRVKDVTLLLNNKSVARQKLIAQREISDRIGVTEPMNALPVLQHEGHFINHISLREDAEGFISFTWDLTLADATQYWYLEIPGFTELDFTTRLGFGLVIGHTDIAHQDQHANVIHSDTAHNDQHGDVAHSNAAHDDVTHTDTPHSNVAHGDVAHGDAHGDQAHGDDAHQDSHSNIAHNDGHGNVDHQDQSHGDSPGQGYTNTHDDNHSNTHDDYHTDQGPPYGYLNSHGDYHQDAHQNSHIDDGGWPHTNIPHYDGAHTNWHSNVGHQDAHSNVAHTNVAGGSWHTNTAHTNVAHADYHANTGHGDASHGDITHVNTHTNVVHNDVAHSDSHGDLAHGDMN